MARRKIDLAASIEVQRLLDEGELSHRAIAARTGVSYGTVGDMSRGERLVDGTRKKPPDEPPPPWPDCRGRGCGDCVACRAAAYVAQRLRAARQAARK